MRICDKDAGYNAPGLTVTFDKILEIEYISSSDFVLRKHDFVVSHLKHLTT